MIKRVKYFEMKFWTTKPNLFVDWCSWSFCTLSNSWSSYSGSTFVFMFGSFGQLVSLCPCYLQHYTNMRNKGLGYWTYDFILKILLRLIFLEIICLFLALMVLVLASYKKGKKVKRSYPGLLWKFCHNTTICRLPTRLCGPDRTSSYSHSQRTLSCNAYKT